ncbi:MAG: heparan-alpha-glucosaminide N-acetyltransferase domain-containing protein [Bacteroidota bacterium]
MPEQPIQSTPTTSRLQFIDYFRGFAVLMMIETHVVNALLHPSLRDSDFFKVLTFINGLVAPSFLFCAGFALAITLTKKHSDFFAMNSVFRKYIFRITSIFAFGYLLHLPVFSLRKMIHLSDDKQWMLFLQSDILQVIALSLIFLTLFFLIVKEEKKYLLLITAIGLFVVFASPIVRAFNLDDFPMWFRPYFTLKYKSQFPLFPWSAFVIAGVLFGYGYLFVRKKENAQQYFSRLPFYALGGILCSLVIELLPLTLYPSHNFWNASPEFFFVRIGIVVVFCYAFWWLENNLQTINVSFNVLANKIFDSFFLFLVTLGKESLLVYITHLLIIYGFANLGMSYFAYFGKNMNYAQCVLLTLTLEVAMFALAYYWGWLKANKKGTFAKLQFATFIVALICFLVM